MWRWLFNSMKLMFLVLDLLIERASRGGGSTGSRGAPAPLDSKKNMEPLLNPPSIFEKKRGGRRRGRRKGRRGRRNQPL